MNNQNRKNANMTKKTQKTEILKLALSQFFTPKPVRYNYNQQICLTLQNSEKQVCAGVQPAGCPQK